MQNITFHATTDVKCNKIHHFENVTILLVTECIFDIITKRRKFKKNYINIKSYYKLEN